MRAIVISLRLLWQRKIANFILVFEIILSVIMLSQLFVFITKHIDHVRAVNELPVAAAAALSPFAYYDAESIIEALDSERSVDGIGRVYIGSAAYNQQSCNIAVYSNAVIQHYTPSLSKGKWLIEAPIIEDDSKPVVVSKELGYDIGDKFSIRVTNNYIEDVQVIGILKEPTQYLFTKGSASPQNFSADLIIDQNPVVIMREIDCIALPQSYIPKESGITDTLFVFFSTDATDTQINELITQYSRYGEFTAMSLLVENYTSNTRVIICGGLLFFIVFFLLAITSTLSMNLIQQAYNQKRFTVYYLLGMNKWQMFFVEVARIMILEIVVMGLTLLSGRMGLLMLEWMSRERIVIFYSVAFLMTMLIFVSVSAGFWMNLIHTDISQSLKDLQHGE